MSFYHSALYAVISVCSPYFIIIIINCNLHTLINYFMYIHLDNFFLGYIWWSTFFSLAPTIWFFPMNMLEISGYEAFAVLLLSPIFTLIPFVDRCISSRYGVILMQILTVFSVLCYHAPSAFSRLLITSFGNFFAMLWLCGVWWFKSKIYR